MAGSLLRNVVPSLNSLTGGKSRRKRSSKKCKTCKTSSCAHKKSSGKNKKGGFAQIISDAIVPFGLFALTRRKQNKMKKSRRARKSRRSRR